MHVFTYKTYVNENVSTPKGADTVLDRKIDR